MSRLSIEIRWWIGLLLALQLLTSFAGIGLLARVSPAVEEILRDNEYTVEAVEAMLALLAAESGPLSTDARAQFEAAYARARDNVTESEEGPLLDAISLRARGALDGDIEARRSVVVSLRSLSQVNRASMRRADQRAQRIGGGGAWAAALSGVVGFCVGMLVLRRLLVRLILPVLQIDSALDGARRGDPHRRCVPLMGPVEIGRIGENVNWLLDALAARTVHSDGGLETLRAALLLEIDADPNPIAIVGPDGMLAMNTAAYTQADKDPSPASLSAALRAHRPTPVGWTVTSLDGSGWYCTHKAPS